MCPDVTWLKRGFVTPSKSDVEPMGHSVFGVIYLLTQMLRFSFFNQFCFLYIKY